MESFSNSDEKEAIREPLLGTELSKGGFRTIPFIIANEAFERVASLALMPNMILYLTREYGMETAKAANILFFWSAASNFAPIIAAFLADSYVGRFPMIAFGSVVSFLGTVLLWLTAMFPQARPPCDQFSNICKSPTTSQLVLLYSSFGVMSVGAGGIRSSSIAFGADQLDKRDNSNFKNAAALESFFSWYYVAVTVSALVAITCVVYIQDNLGWKVGFGIPAVLMFLSAISFFLASRFYVKFNANASLLTGFAQVLAASFRNRDIQLSSKVTDGMYHHKKGSLLLMPSEKLRILNKACIIRKPQQDLTLNGSASNPWSLCTVEQVEELKSLIKVIPLWSTGIMISMTIVQGPFPVLQAASMDRHITSNFEIPAGSFGTFMIISLVLWVALYDRVILRLASRINGKPVCLTLKQRMGIGMICSVASMAAMAILESIRRKTAFEEGLLDNPRATVRMSVMWVLPYQVLGGLAEAFNAIAQNEFFYSELPKTMSSIASTLFGVGMSTASLMASLLITIIDDVTTRGGDESWVSSNINKGHYDYYYWLLVGLSLANFLYFLVCSKAYGPCKAEGSKVISQKDGIRDD